MIPNKRATVNLSLTIFISGLYGQAPEFSDESAGSLSAFQIVILKAGENSTFSRPESLKRKIYCLSL